MGHGGMAPSLSLGAALPAVPDQVGDDGFMQNSFSAASGAEGK
jgi:hypothetical protein